MKVGLPSLLLVAALSAIAGWFLGRSVERASELGRVLALEQRTVEMWQLVGLVDSLTAELTRRGLLPPRGVP